MLTLQEITRQNWIKCTRLRLRDDQVSFVASNIATIAESKFETHHRLRAIYGGKKMIGMIAYCHETEPEDLQLYWIFRLMIRCTSQKMLLPHGFTVNLDSPSSGRLMMAMFCLRLRRKNKRCGRLRNTMRSFKMELPIPICVRLIYGTPLKSIRLLIPRISNPR